MKKILVTGANGYIGEGVVKALKKRGVEIVATDFKFNEKEDSVTKIEADLFSIDDPYHYFDEPDILLHLAWRDGFQHFSLAHIEDMPKHFEFIKRMIDGGIKHISCMGSMHEVGFFEGSIDEGTPTNPLSYYGISKNSLRQALELLAKDNGVVYQWIRGYYIVGNTSKGCSIFSKITDAEKRGEKEFPFTTGMNQFDFIDYDEFCEQVAVTVLQEKVNGIINCCSGNPERLKDRVERFIKDNNYKIKLKYGAFQDRPYDSKAVWGNPQKIKQILGEIDENKPKIHSS